MGQDFLNITSGSGSNIQYNQNSILIRLLKKITIRVRIHNPQSEYKILNMYRIFFQYDVKETIFTEKYFFFSSVFLSVIFKVVDLIPDQDI